MAKYNTAQEALDDWIYLFANEGKLYNQFCEIWKDMDAIKVSDFYKVVKASEESRTREIGIAYRTVMIKHRTPLASMNAALVERYSEEMLEANLRLDIAGGKSQPLVNVVKDYEAKRIAGLQVPKPDNTDGYTAEQLFGLIIKDQHGRSRKFQPGYNSKVLRVVDVSVPADALIVSLGTINTRIRNGRWTIVKGEPVVTRPFKDLTSYDGVCFTVKSASIKSPIYTLKSTIDPEKYSCYKDDASTPFTQDSKRFIQYKFAEGAWIQVASTKKPQIGDNVKIEKYLPIFDDKTKKPFVPSLEETPTQWQHYDAQTDTYSTQPEEEPIMTPSTRTISIEVSTKPFAKTETITMFGRNVSSMTEDDMYNEITYIQTEVDKLTALKTGSTSKRIKAKLDALKAAKEELIHLIDALPEEE